MALPLVVLVAQLLAGSSPDAEPTIRMDLSPPTATPAQLGNGPSYEETVAWLSGHAAAQAVSSTKLAGAKIRVSVNLDATKWPCVLSVSTTGLSEKTGAQVNTSSLLALSQLNTATIGVRDGSSCVSASGSSSTWLAVKLEGNVATEGKWSPAGSICYVNREQATRAAKAISRLAELCGAQNRPEPF